MTEEQRKVVDVLSGKTDKSRLIVERNGETINLEIMQGSENKAGSKHAIFRHFGTRNDYFTSEDILLIPDIVRDGERLNDGKKSSYTLVRDGVLYILLLKSKGMWSEWLFYTDKKAPTELTQNTSNDARTNNADALSADKGSANSSDVQTSGGETTGTGGRLADKFWSRRRM